jgi:hypothetical protein
MGKILSILNFVCWVVKRCFMRADDPQRQYDKAKTDNAKIIHSGDAAGLNRKLDDGTDRLPKHTGDYPVGS